MIAKNYNYKISKKKKLKEILKMLMYLVGNLQIKAFQKPTLV